MDRSRLFARTALATALGVVAVAVGAAEPVRLTLYQNGLALIQEARQLQPAADGWVQLDRISAAAVVDSLRLTPRSGAVRQQSFRHDPPTLTALLERNIGQRVTLLHTNAGSGGEDTSTPLLVAVEGGRVLVADKDHIESLPIADPAWRFRFAALPEGLTVRPVLRAQLDSASAREAELSYLSGGLDWQAHYRLVMGTARGNQASGEIEAWVGVSNDNDLGWRDAVLELVAGQLHRVTPDHVPGAHGAPVLRAMAAEALMADAAPARASLGDYHLYRFPAPVTLPAHERRDLHLLARPAVQVERDYRIDFGGNPGLYQPIAAEQPRPAAIRLRVDNRGGEPLPAGAWRVYGRDADGVLRLLGEDAADAVPVGRELRLDIGQAFDVTATRVQTRFVRMNNRETESDWRVELANAGDTPLDVQVIERLGSNAEISDESLKHASPDALTAQWTLALKAGESRVLSYRIHTRQR